MAEKINGLVISDIHFGIKESERLFHELDLFLETADDSNLDIIHINGDYFEKKISLNDSVSRFAINFFEKLVRICIKNDIKLRVLQGTRSHDLDQLENFNHYLSNTEIDYKVFSIAEEEEIKGVRYLYVPEEYPKDHREHYAHWIKNKPDVMMGHGTWDFVAFDNQIAESENSSKSAPIFMYDEWKDIKYFACFGHIHGRQEYKKKIYYPGSFTRWVYGEPKQKGFIKYTIDLEKEKHKVEFVDNLQAPIFQDLSFTDKGIDIEEMEVEDLVKLAKQTLEDDSISSVRLNLDGLSETKQLLVKKALGENSDVKFKVKAKKNFNVDKDYLEYDFIEDEKLTIGEKIQMYIQKEFDKELDIEFINANIVEEE